MNRKALTFVSGLLVSAGCAFAQSVVVGDTTASVVSASTSDGAGSEWGAFSSLAKTTQLRAWAQNELGCTLTPSTQSGFTTSITVRYTKNGVSTDQPVKISIVPLTGSPTRHTDGQTALMLVRYTSTPSLAYPRLLYRNHNGQWHVSEYAYRLNNTTTLMTANFGDCLMRSALKILEQRSPSIHTALRSRLNQTAGGPLVGELKSVMDVRQPSCGQRDLLLTQALCIASNVEEEFAGSVITNTLDNNFRPQTHDSALVRQVKALAKQTLTSLRQQVQNYLWNQIRSWLGI